MGDLTLNSLLRTCFRVCCALALGCAVYRMRDGGFDVSFLIFMIC